MIIRSIAERLRRLEIEANKGNVFPKFVAELDDGTKKVYECFDWFRDYEHIIRVWVNPKHLPSCDDVALLLAFSPTIEVLEAK